MERYKNLDGDSGIAGFETGDDFIRVQFTKGGIYRYSHTRAGRERVENMKKLAEYGDGLNAYINRHVHTLYDPRGI